MQVTTPPTGWTKDLTYNDYTLRCTTGTASSGGTVNFSTAMAAQTGTITIAIPNAGAGGTALSEPQSPLHIHQGNLGAAPYGTTLNASRATPPVSLYQIVQPANPNPPVPVSPTVPTSPGPTSGGGSHTHALSFTSVPVTKNLAVKYVDCIIATRD
jgi:hypothetical protein